MQRQSLRSFGDHLRGLRKQRAWSQETLAEEAGMDRTYVSGVERGCRNISLLNLCKMADALAITLPELVTFERPPTKGGA